MVRGLNLFEKSVSTVLAFSVVMMVLVFPITTLQYEYRVEPKSNPSLERQNEPAYIPHEAISIMGDVNLTSIATSEGWPGNGNATNPYIISGYSIVVTNETAIHIQDTTLHLRVENCILSGDLSGLYLYNVENASIASVECMDGGGSGLIASHCRYVSIYNVTCYGYAGGTGVQIYSSRYMTVERIYSHHNSNGIGLMGFSNSTLTHAMSYSNAIRGFDVSSEDCVIEHVRCWDNNYGFDLISSDNVSVQDSLCLDNRHAGIAMQNVDHSTFQNITCTRNEGHGFEVMNSAFNVFDGVIVLDEYFGIRLNDFSHHNRIESSVFAFCTYGLLVYGSLNDIVDNAIVRNGLSQASDDGSGNFWDDGVSLGNHWSDYSGNGSYDIQGVVGSVDHYPNPDFGRAPLMNQPADISISVPTAISWVAYDTDPDFYTVWVDGSIEKTESWNGHNINYLVHDISSGQHNVTLEVFDAGGNRTTSTVLVHCLTDIPYFEYEDFIPRDILFIGGNEDSQWGAFPGDGTIEHPYILENFYFSLNDTGGDACIKLYNLDEVHVIVRNCIFQGINELESADPYFMDIRGIGVDIQRTGNVTITNCTFQTLYSGVYVLDSSNCTIEDSIFRGNPYGTPLNYGAAGIRLDINTDETSDFTVRGNRIVMCSSGISLHHTSESTFVNNHVHSCDDGLSLSSASNYNHIEDNNFSSNTFNGISIMGSTYNTVTGNNCTHNGNAGILIDEGTNNQITENDFSSNLYGALDESFTPNFYDYNMYSDYTGVDEDGDGIGDTPHTIPGRAGAVDEHPRVAWVAVTITTSSPTTSGDDGPELETMTLIIAGAGMMVILVIVVLVNKSRNYT